MDGQRGHRGGGIPPPSRFYPPLTVPCSLLGVESFPRPLKFQVSLPVTAPVGQVEGGVKGEGDFAKWGGFGDFQRKRKSKETRC